METGGKGDCSCSANNINHILLALFRRGVEEGARPDKNRSQRKSAGINEAY
jgi:hypothetical protein